MTVPKSDYATKHFYYNRLWLHLCGLWAPDTNSKFIYYLYKSYQIFIIVFVNIFFLITEVMAIKDTRSNFRFLIKNINFPFCHLLGNFKNMCWFFRGKELMHIMDTLQDEQFQYEDANDFNPGKVTKDAKRVGNINTLLAVGLAHGVLSMSYFPAIYTAVYHPNFEVDEFGNKTFSQILPYFSVMPFKTDTVKSYLWALFYQSGPMIVYGWSIGAMDSLFMNILNNIGAQFLILKGAFRTIRQRSILHLNGQPLLRPDGLYNSEALEDIMALQMKKCVVHLQSVIDMCDLLERVHTYLTLGQVLGTLTIFCTSLFLIASTPFSAQFSAEIVYMAAVGIELVFYCWFGNEVHLRANDIPMSIWEGDWFESSLSFRRSMLITMSRMRKPIYLTAGKFSPLTLDTFVSISKGSYSFFAVLNEANE